MITILIRILMHFLETGGWIVFLDVAARWRDSTFVQWKILMSLLPKTHGASFLHHLRQQSEMYAYLLSHWLQITLLIMVLERWCVWCFFRKSWLCWEAAHLTHTRYKSVKLCVSLSFSFQMQAYRDLQSRENTRNAAWQRDGWDEIVYYTGRSNISLDFYLYIKSDHLLNSFIILPNLIHLNFQQSSGAWCSYSNRIKHLWSFYFEWSFYSGWRYIIKLYLDTNPWNTLHIMGISDCFSSCSSSYSTYGI